MSSLDDRQLKTQTFEELIQEELEMNTQRLEECQRCHSPIKGDLFDLHPTKPWVVYKQPVRCNTCNDEEWFSDFESKQAKPKPERSLLCKCQFPDCGKEFYARVSWYKKWQACTTPLAPLMPVLIDTDSKKVSELLADNENELISQS